VAVAGLRSVQTGHRIGGDWAGACLADREGDTAAARPAPSRLQPAHAAACDGLLLRPQKRQVQGWLLPQAEQFVRSALLTSVQVVHCQSHAPTGGVGKRGVWTGRGSSALKTVLQEPHRTLMMRSPPEQAVSSTDEHVGHRTRTRELDTIEHVPFSSGLTFSTVFCILAFRKLRLTAVSHRAGRELLTQSFTWPARDRLLLGKWAVGKNPRN